MVLLHSVSLNLFTGFNLWMIHFPLQAIVLIARFAVVYPHGTGSSNPFMSGKSLHCSHNGKEPSVGFMFKILPFNILLGLALGWYREGGRATLFPFPLWITRCFLCLDILAGLSLKSRECQRKCSQGSVSTECCILL